jgi:hypothetical protein
VPVEEVDAEEGGDADGDEAAKNRDERDKYRRLTDKSPCRPSRLDEISRAERPKPTETLGRRLARHRRRHHQHRADAALIHG